MHEIHPDLQQTVRMVRLTAGLVAAMVLGMNVVLFLVTLQTSVPASQRLIIQAVALLDSVVIGALAALFAQKLTQWYRRATLLTMTMSGAMMRVRLQQVMLGRAPGWTATLLPHPSQPEQPPHTLQILAPNWEITQLTEDTDVEVLTDGTPSSPVVLRTPYGLLWERAQISRLFRRA